MRLRHIARNAQPEPRAARIAVARRLQAVKGLEHLLELIRRYARAIVADTDLEAPPVPHQDARAATKLDGVGDEVSDAALQRLWLTWHRCNRASLHRDVLAHLNELSTHRLEQQTDIDRLQCLLVIEAAKERQRAAHHALHFIELLAKPRLQGRIVDLRLDLEPQPRERRLEVMRHGRQD